MKEGKISIEAHGERGSGEEIEEERQMAFES